MNGSLHSQPSNDERLSSTTCGTSSHIDRAWRIQGREHYGIISVPKRMSVGVIVQRLQQHLDTITPETQYNTVLWL
jgi:hypothetical protein